MHAPTRTTIESRNRDEGEALVKAAYAENRLRVGGGEGPFRMRMDRVDIGALQFDDLANTLSLNNVMAPLSALSVIQVLEGRVDIDTGSRESQALPGDVMLPTRPGEGYSSCLDGARLRIATLDFALVDDVLGEPATGLPRLYRTEALHPAAARRWVSTVDHVSRTVLTDGAAPGELLLGAAGRLMAALFVETFDPDSSQDAPSDRADATSAAVRRALAFIDTNCDRDIGVADIARASYVSVRSLQIAFRRHLGTTPLLHLRRTRLELARAELRRRTPEELSVTEVAVRWGFSQSRFARYYREAFDELPSVTLRS